VACAPPPRPAPRPGARPCLALLPFALLLLAACAGPAHSARGGVALPDDLQERLAARGATLLGQPGPFRIGPERFNGDCSGFVEAVYQAEGIPLRALLARTTPNETSAAAGLYQVAKRYGVVFGGGGEWPAPGDLVFFHDTYDRNHDGRSNPFTHVGLVERVDRDGTVTFLHRGSRAVVRAAVTPSRPDVTADRDGTLRNSPLRGKQPAQREVPSLAGQLFAGYGRVDPRRVPGAR